MRFAIFTVVGPQASKRMNQYVWGKAKRRPRIVKAWHGTQGNRAPKTKNKKQLPKKRDLKPPHVQIRGKQKTNEKETTSKARIPLSAMQQKTNSERNTKERGLVGREAPNPMHVCT